MNEINIMEVGGFSCGHAQNTEAATGCTVVLFDDFCPAGLDVRGGGPASRESQLLNPLMALQGINAILLSGGSAFGLDAAGGVQAYLEEKGIGFDVGVTRVPIVCQASLFDLTVSRMDVRPDAAMAREACNNASHDRIEEGNVGAGCGCSVGKYRGMDRAMKSGFGTFAVQAGNIKVGALVAVNALGDVFEDGKQIAGLKSADEDGFSDTFSEMVNDLEKASDLSVEELYSQNTTLGIIVTNASFDKAELCKIAGMTHNGYARAIRPVHTGADGDSIYAVSAGDKKADINTIGEMAAFVMEKAIIRAVKSAGSAYGLPGLKAE